MIGLANALERTLHLYDGTLSDKSLQFINTMTTANELPYFSRNPLEWLNFKEVYELTMELGSYGDRSNMTCLGQRRIDYVSISDCIEANTKSML